jgi:hypothetical protein
MDRITALSQIDRVISRFHKLTESVYNQKKLLVRDIKTNLEVEHFIGIKSCVNLIMLNQTKLELIEDVIYALEMFAGDIPEKDGEGDDEVLEEGIKFGMGGTKVFKALNNLQGHEVTSSMDQSLAITKAKEAIVDIIMAFNMNEVEV